MDNLPERIELREMSFGWDAAFNLKKYSLLKLSGKLTKGL